MAARILLTGAAAATAVAGAAARNVTCPETPLAPGLYTFDLNFDGRAREFNVYVPTTYTNEPTALFFGFHGYTNSMEHHERISAMSVVSEEEGFISIIPAGFQASWNAGWCCGQAVSLDLDDVGLTRAMVDYVEQRTCVDRSLIFASGFSNGGFMSYRLACEAADLVRAVGSNAGNLATPNYFPCEPDVAVPVIHFHGTADTTIPYDGAVRSIERYTQEIANCNLTPVETFRNGTASCVTYSECDNNGEVVFCTIENGDHSWPGCASSIRSECGRANNDINATREMWKFFARIGGISKGNFKLIGEPPLDRVVIG